MPSHVSLKYGVERSLCNIISDHLIIEIIFDFKNLVFFYLFYLIAKYLIDHIKKYYDTLRVALCVLHHLKFVFLSL